MLSYPVKADKLLIIAKQQHWSTSSEVHDATRPVNVSGTTHFTGKTQYAVSNVKLLCDS